MAGELHQVQIGGRNATEIAAGSNFTDNDGNGEADITIVAAIGKPGTIAVVCAQQSLQSGSEQQLSSGSASSAAACPALAAIFWTSWISQAIASTGFTKTPTINRPSIRVRSTDDNENDAFISQGYLRLAM